MALFACFLSKCWGGRASDRCITMNSGFLDLLSSGDTVLADRGFTISDDLALFGAKLEITSFTTGKKQLSLQEVECSKRFSKVRNHSGIAGTNVMMGLKNFEILIIFIGGCGQF